MAQMILYFKSENNNFDDLLQESCIKKADIKLFYYQGMIVNGEFTDQQLNFLYLKYGDQLINPVKDYKPIPYKDYTPIRN
jgi:hypothetical protein